MEEERAMTIKDAIQETTPPEPSTMIATPHWLAGAGIAGGLLTVVASSCCIIPLGLAALGAGAGIVGRLAFLSDWRLHFLALSLAAVVGSWVTWRRRQATACVSALSCAAVSRSRGILALLICASMVVTTAAGWGYIKPVLLKLARGR